VGNWHPLTWISHAIDYSLWGLNPLGHHLSSIVLHAINTALVVLVIQKLLEVESAGKIQDSTASKLNNQTMLIAAGVAGLLFGIHPVHVESVAWVAERKDLLCALFFLLSIMMYVDFARSRQSEEKRQETVGKDIQKDNSANDDASQRKSFMNKQYLLTLGFFSLALLSKPMAVTLPAVLLILDWYPLGRIRSLSTARASIVEKIPFVVLSVASSIITIVAQGAGGAILSGADIPLSVRALTAVQSLIAYLGKMFLPVNLLPFYPYPKHISLISFKYLALIVCLAAISATCVILARKQKFWLSAWGYYVVTLIPVIGIVQVGGQSMADRYTYLPSLGPFVVVGLCVKWLVEKVSTRKRERAIFAGIFITLLLLMAGSLCYLTIRQIGIWRDSITLWTSVIMKEPDTVPMAYVNRGAALQKKGLYDKAAADYEEAIALDPSAYRAYISLGSVLEQMGQFDGAMGAVGRAIALNPSSSEAYRNRGTLFEKTGRFDEAIADYTRAINLRPSYYEAYNNRGLTFAKIGQFERSITDYNDAISINPRYYNAYLNRGVAYTLTAQYDKALEDFNRSVSLGLNDPAAYYNRGMLYRRTGNTERAILDVRKACDLGSEKACGVLQQLMQGSGAQ
jgi:protein O-mannosyl-transferase